MTKSKIANPIGRPASSEQQEIKKKIWELYLDQIPSKSSKHHYSSIARMCGVSSQYAIQVITRKKADILDVAWELQSDPAALVQYLQNVVGGSIRYSPKDVDAGTSAIDPTVGSGKGVA